jgi:hypothetical protein
MQHIRPVDPALLVRGTIDDVRTLVPIAEQVVTRLEHAVALLEASRGEEGSNDA